MASTDQHTPRRNIRVDANRWDNFGTMAGPRNRTRLIVEFIDWYIGVPGAALPQRPTSVTSRSSAA